MVRERHLVPSPKEGLHAKSLAERQEHFRARKHDSGELGVEFPFDFFMEMTIFDIRTSSWIALLGILAGCNGSDATIGPKLRAANDNLVADGGGSNAGQMFTTTEGIAFLEARAKDDSTFLDRQHVYSSSDGTHTTTFRALLTVLKGQSLASSGQQNSSLGSQFALAVTSPVTLADDGYTGTNVPVGASMNVSPGGSYSATQTLTVHNIPPGDFSLPFTRGPSSTWPWGVTGSVQSSVATTYSVRTIHTASGGGSSASAESTDSGNIIDP